MMTKREAVRAILDGTGADRIPVIMNAFSLPVMQYGYTMPEVLMSPEKMTECMVGTRKRLGYDGLCAGAYGGIAAMMGGHLPDSEGNVTGMGEDVVHSMEDIKKLAFRAMVKNVELFRALSDYVEDAVVESCKIIMDAGVDFLWFPTPNFGGYCISRKTYEKCISESNIRALKRIKDNGAQIVLHTCGLYDDRFDLVLKESGDAWHISDTSTKKVKEQYGDKVSLMGSIPCVPVLMEGTEQEVYDFCYKECMDAAQDGRFILSGDCDVPPGTSDENMKAAVRAAKDAEKILFGKTK